MTILGVFLFDLNNAPRSSETFLLGQKSVPTKTHKHEEYDAWDAVIFSFKPHKKKTRHLKTSMRSSIFLKIP